MHFFLAVARRARVRGGLDLQGAIDEPNWHDDSFPGSFHPRAMHPGSVTVEGRTDPGVIAEPRRRGHDITVDEPWSEGRLCAVARDPRNRRRVRRQPARHAGVRRRPLTGTA